MIRTEIRFWVARDQGKGGGFTMKGVKAFWGGGDKHVRYLDCSGDYMDYVKLSEFRELCTGKG